MKILVIPEITSIYQTFKHMFGEEEKINSQTNQIAVANMASWSLLFGDEPKNTLEMIMMGYTCLSKSEVFKDFNIYIGLLPKVDISRVDTIIYSSEAAKEIIEQRELKDSLPIASETIVIKGEMTLENEIYKRTIIRNLSKGFEETN